MSYTSEQQYKQQLIIAILIMIYHDRSIQKCIYPVVFSNKDLSCFYVVAATVTECTVIRIRVFKVITFHHSISVIQNSHQKQPKIGGLNSSSGSQFGFKFRFKLEFGFEFGFEFEFGFRFEFITLIMCFPCIHTYI